MYFVPSSFKILRACGIAHCAYRTLLILVTYPQLALNTSNSKGMRHDQAVTSFKKWRRWFSQFSKRKIVVSISRCYNAASSYKQTRTNQFLFHYTQLILITIVELAIALLLLERQLGVSCLAPATVALFSTMAILIMAKYMGNAQKIWIQGIQTRVDVTASVLGSMKVILDTRSWNVTIL